MKDPIVESLKKDFDTRSKKGIEKYGTTLQDNNQDDFLQHALEEAMDLSLYLKKLIVLRDGEKAEGLISLDKKYITRQGDKVKLSKIIDPLNEYTSYPVNGSIWTSFERWEQITWTLNGEYDLDCLYSPYDLIEVKE